MTDTFCEQSLPGIENSQASDLQRRNAKFYPVNKDVDQCDFIFFLTKDQSKLINFVFPMEKNGVEFIVQ